MYVVETTSWTTDLYSPEGGSLPVQDLDQLVHSGQVSRHGGLLQQSLGPGAGERLLQQDRGVQCESSGRVAQVFTGSSSEGHGFPLSAESELLGLLSAKPTAKASTSHVSRLSSHQSLSIYWLG